MKAAQGGRQARAGGGDKWVAPGGRHLNDGRALDTTFASEVETNSTAEEQPRASQRQDAVAKTMEYRLAQREQAPPRRGCCGWALKRVRRPGEPAAEWERKQLLLPACLTMSAVMTFFSLDSAKGKVDWMQAGGGDGVPGSDGPLPLHMGDVGVWVIAIGVGAMAESVFASRRLPLSWVQRFCAVMTAGVIMLDWGMAACGNGEAWPFGVVVMDMLLCVNASTCATTTCLVCVILWVVVRSVEDVYRIGVYDFPYTTGITPGPRGALLNNLGIRLLPFILDFWFTRKFSAEVRGSVMLAREVAQALARYNLGAAAAALDRPDAASLPQDLRIAYVDLIQNLSEYRPYLPQSVLHKAQRSVMPVRAGGGTRDERSAVSIFSGTPSDSDDDASSTDSCNKSDMSLGSTVMSAQQSPRSPRGRGRDKASPTASPRPDRPDTLHVGVSPRNAQRRPASSVGDSPIASVRTSHSSWNGPATSMASTAMSPVVATQRLPAPGATPERVTGGWFRSEPKDKLVTLAALNCVGFLRAAQTRGRAQEWIAVGTEVAAEWVAREKGVIDLLSADRRYISFGAARACAAQRIAASRCAWGITAAAAAATARGGSPRGGSPRGGDGPGGALWPATGSVCHGSCLCGDFGSTKTSMRFMSIGGAASLLLVTERLAATWRARLVADAATHADLEQEWDCRLRDRIIYEKRGSSRPLRLWQVTGGPDVDNDGAGPDEWMYELGNRAPNPWVMHNEVLEMWMEGRSTLAIKKAFAAGAEARELEDAYATSNGGASIAAELQQAIALLQERITDGVMPSLVVGDVATSREAQTDGADGLEETVYHAEVESPLDIKPRKAQDPSSAFATRAATQAASCRRLSYVRGVTAESLVDEQRRTEEEQRRVRDAEHQRQQKRVRDAVQLRKSQQQAGGKTGRVQTASRTAPGTLILAAQNAAHDGSAPSIVTTSTGRKMSKVAPLKVEPPLARLTTPRGPAGQPVPARPHSVSDRPGGQDPAAAAPPAAAQLPPIPTPTTDSAAAGAPASKAEESELQRLLRDMGLLQHLRVLEGEGILAPEDLVNVTDANDLPDSMPLVARRKLARHALKHFTAPAAPDSPRSPRKAKQGNIQSPPPGLPEAAVSCVGVI